MILEHDYSKSQQIAVNRIKKLIFIIVLQIIIVINSH